MAQASGVLSTANQVGNTIGVAAICLAVAALVQLLPGRGAPAPAIVRPEPRLD